MVWVDSPKFFCVFLETLTYVANTLIHMPIPVPGYKAIVKISKTRPGLTQTLDSLTFIDCYIYDVITAVQGLPDQQRRVFDGIVWALKWIFLSLHH